MGGGRKNSSDVPKRLPTSYLASAGGGDAEFGGAARARSFCATPLHVAFAAVGDEVAAVGTVIRLVQGPSLNVMAGRRWLGVVAGSVETALRGCIEIGYEMRGEVVAFDSDTRSGTVRVSGRLRDAA